MSKMENNVLAPSITPLTAKDAQNSVVLNGYTLAVPEIGLIELTAPSGQICVSIRLEPSGPVIEARAASLRLATEGELTVDCERFSLHARQDITLVAGGNIAHDAHGDIVFRADGELATEAAGQQHHARLGSVDIRANDDVMLDGERVMLNGPRAFAVPPTDLASRQVNQHESPVTLPVTATGAKLEP